MPRPAPPPLPDPERHLRAVDPVLAQLIKHHGPCPLRPEGRDPFHTLCRSIIGQQLSTKAADTIQGRVALHVGAKTRFHPRHFEVATLEGLRSCGLSNAKARWLRELAARVRDKRFSFTQLRKLSDEDAIEALDALPGIGRWTAEMFLIFALGRPDVFALDDAGLRRAINSLYGKGRRLSDRRALQISRGWAPYRSVASWYLWRSLDAPASG